MGFVHAWRNVFVVSVVSIRFMAATTFVLGLPGTASVQVVLIGLVSNRLFDQLVGWLVGWLIG